MGSSRRSKNSPVSFNRSRIFSLYTCTAVVVVVTFVWFQDAARAKEKSGAADTFLRTLEESSPMEYAPYAVLFLFVFSCRLHSSRGQVLPASPFFRSGIP